jgi:hypothetical protein
MIDQMDELGKQLDHALANKYWMLASQILTKMWLASQMAMTQITEPTLKELTYLKTPVETDDGEYLLLFIHTKGKKIQL